MQERLGRPGAAGTALLVYVCPRHDDSVDARCCFDQDAEAIGALQFAAAIRSQG
jgi:hypothetical protein